MPVNIPAPLAAGIRRDRIRVAVACRMGSYRPGPKAWTEIEARNAAIEELVAALATGTEEHAAAVFTALDLGGADAALALVRSWGAS